LDDLTVSRRLYVLKKNCGAKCVPNWKIKKKKIENFQNGGHFRVAYIPGIGVLEKKISNKNTPYDEMREKINSKFKTAAIYSLLISRELCVVKNFFKQNMLLMTG
jgi:hypothetical protein